MKKMLIAKRKATLEDENEGTTQAKVKDSSILEHLSEYLGINSSQLPILWKYA